MTKSNMKSGSDVPVLFIVFNRPDHAAKVFEAIKKNKPKKLFIAADGPRINNEKDERQCEETKALIELIDWPCDLQTRFLDENLGCKLAVSSAISWFFEHVEHGIILEDDCVPNLSFFTFCAEVLEKYRDDERIMQISGNNFTHGKHNNDASYYFSTLNDIWGWATWRRAWKHFELSMPGYSTFKRKNLLNTYIGNPKIVKWLELYFNDTFKVGSSVWSSQWTYAMARNNGLTIVPSLNLVRNIGFDELGTHKLVDSWNYYNDYPVVEMKSITHPEFMVPDREAEKLRFEVIRKTDPRMFIKNRLRRHLNSLYKKISQVFD